MGISILAAVIIAAMFYFFGRNKAHRQRVARQEGIPHSLPFYHGIYAALLTFDFAIVAAIAASILQAILMAPTLDAAGFKVSSVDADAFSITAYIVPIVTCIAALFGGFLATKRIDVEFRARNAAERLILLLMIFCSAIAILTTFGIVFSLLFEAIRFFEQINFFSFLLGTLWSPQQAFGVTDVSDIQHIFGFIPVISGTLLITVIAICVAGPIGLLSAIYLSDYASARVRSVAKPVLEILAGVPTVVYGFFAALTVAPFLRGIGEGIGLDVSSESALAAGLVMGIMIIPFVSSLSDDVINAVPQSLRDGSYGLGATKAETITKVVLPAALPGIVSALMLAISRAIGETMIVVMAAGLAANLTINPLEAVTTVTVQMVTLLTGDQEFDSAKTLASFALGLALFVITLILNVIALRVVRKYREQYD